MTTFTTTITNMYVMPQLDGETDVVVNVLYTVLGVDGQYTASIDGSQIMTIQQGQPFTPYDQLTEAQVIGWLDPSAIASLEACVQGQINSLINPPVSPMIAPLPWSS